MNSLSIGTAARIALLALAVASTARTASAQLTLLSEELRRGAGSWVDPFGPTPPTLNATSWGVIGPFPDTATDSLTLDDSGLRLRVDRRGEHFTSQVGLQGQSSSWTLYDFTIRFRVDEPLPYRFTAAEVANPPFVIYRLGADGESPVFSGFPSFVIPPGSSQRTGILPPGTYTFTGALGDLAGPGFPGFQMLPLQAQFDVIVPEPSAALTLLAAFVLCASRRRRRASPAT